MGIRDSDSSYASFFKAMLNHNVDILPKENRHNE
jgi:hypothetical protein